MLGCGQGLYAVDVIAPFRFVVSEDGNDLELPYYWNHPLDEFNSSIQWAIISVHGASRNADSYYAHVQDIAVALDQNDTTMVLAPQFLIEDDIVAHGLGNEILYWGSGWRGGDLSYDTGSHPRPFRVSSYTVVDEMIKMLADGANFPNLTQIVVTGHSAGGQFTNRYAAGSQMQETVLEPNGIDIRYIVANPSSYVYFNNERRIAGTLDEFEVPSVADPNYCSDYDDYKYGLQSLNLYMGAVGAAGIRTQYQQREVVYLLGERDNDPEGSGLATSCPAMWEGNHRFERGTIYFNYLRYYFGSSILNKHTKRPVPGVAHSSYFMYNSYNGLKSLFDYEYTDVLADVLKVDADAPVDGNGLSWATAFDNLKDALHAAASSPGEVNEIWVANGTYKPDLGSGARSQSHHMVGGVGVYGGFAGIDSVKYPGGETLRSQRDPAANVTILSGDLNGDDNTGGDNSENSYHVITGSGYDGTAVLDGFTITAGNADGVSPHTRAGGLYNHPGSPTVTNCIFIDNSAEYGGAMYNRNDSHPVVTDCKFISNSASNDGGAISCYRDGLPVHPTITNCLFADNSTVDDGGAIYCRSSTPTITNCTFTGNSTDDNGGACYGATSASPTIINCTFSNNSSGDRGGGIYNSSSSTSTITNCIFWGNDDAGGTDESAQVHDDGSGATVTYSCIQNISSYSGSGNIGSSPLFVDADGPDNTVGTEDDNLRLSAGSGCIDAGDNIAVPPDTNDLDGDGNTVELIPWDLDGRDRFADGDCNDTEIVDMGAYEFTYAYFGDFDGQCDVDFVDYAILVNYWMTDEFLVDIAPTPAGDGIVDEGDLDVLCDNWLFGK